MTQVAAPPQIRELTLADETATVRLARAVAALARPGDVIGLGGELGVGKTRFARAFIDYLAGDGEEVPSPTFTLAQIYETPAATVWHFDLYRLNRAAEARELGLEEAFAEGIALIEWPERLGSLLPAERLDIALAFVADGPPPAGSGPPGGEARRVRLVGHGGWARRLQGLRLDG